MWVKVFTSRAFPLKNTSSAFGRSASSPDYQFGCVIVRSVCLSPSCVDGRLLLKVAASSSLFSAVTRNQMDTQASLAPQYSESAREGNTGPTSTPTTSHHMNSQAWQLHDYMGQAPRVFCDRLGMHISGNGMSNSPKLKQKVGFCVSAPRTFVGASALQT
jgi:hypothetical protein